MVGRRDETREEEAEEEMPAVGELSRDQRIDWTSPRTDTYTRLYLIREGIQKMLWQGHLFMGSFQLVQWVYLSRTEGKRCFRKVIYSVKLFSNIDSRDIYVFHCIMEKNYH